MLNKDTLRYKLEGDEIKPTFIQAAGAILNVTEGLLQFWHSQHGQTRAEINDALTPHLYRARNLMVARGLNKLIEDDSEFTDPEDRRSLRDEAFTRSATALRTAQADVRTHQKQIAASLGLSAKQLYDRLYADLPQAAVLTRPAAFSATQLINTYNMAQAQGLLLYAGSVEVAITDTDTAFRRKLLKSLRFQRLLANIKQDDAGNLLLSVSGPASVLDQHQRYGLQLALFLPAIACASDWAMTATLRPPHKERTTAVKLQLDAGSGLSGHNRFIGYVPEEIQSLVQRVSDKMPDWQIDEQAPLTVLDQGEILVPDVQVRTPQGAWAIEFFHRWHAAPLQRRLRQLEEGQAPHLLMAVDRSLLKRSEFADLNDHPVLVKRGFLFSGFPSPTALRKCVESQ